MKKILGTFLIINVFVICSVIVSATSSAKTVTQQSKSKTTSTTAKDIVRAGLEAMGGEEKLRALRSVGLTGFRMEHGVDQTNLSSGQSFSILQEISELHDLTGNRFKVAAISRNTNNTFTITKIVADEVAAMRIESPNLKVNIINPDKPGSEEWAILAPEKLLLSALDAADLQSGPESIFRGRPYNKITYTWRGIPINIYLHKYVKLPAFVELTRPVRQYPFDIWGDVTTRVYYGKWSMEQNGVRYPLEMATENNGYLAQSVSLGNVVFNAPIPDDSFVIPDNVKAAYKESLKSTQPVISPANQREITSDIIVINESAINTTIVKQNDGIVILEAPTSSAFSIAVINEANRRFPGMPIKAVVSTAPTWNYLGGLREYAARGITIYAIDIHQSLIKQLLAAPFRINPDTLARTQKKPDLRVVASKITIGDGVNRIELLPSHTANEKMIVYFPAQRLLYGSDIAENFDLSRHIIPASLFDLQEFVKRENLVVEKIYGLHTRNAYAWSEMQNALKSLSSDKAQ